MPLRQKKFKKRMETLNRQFSNPKRLPKGCTGHRERISADTINKVGHMAFPAVAPADRIALSKKGGEGDCNSRADLRTLVGQDQRLARSQPAALRRIRFKSYRSALLFAARCGPR
jgi:hypothetical protein